MTPNEMQRRIDEAYLRLRMQNPDDDPETSERRAKREAGFDPNAMLLQRLDRIVDLLSCTGSGRGRGEGRSWKGAMPPIIPVFETCSKPGENLVDLS